MWLTELNVIIQYHKLLLMYHGNLGMPLFKLFRQSVRICNSTLLPKNSLILFLLFSASYHTYVIRVHYFCWSDPIATLILGKIDYSLISIFSPLCPWHQCHIIMYYDTLFAIVGLHPTDNPTLMWAASWRQVPAHRCLVYITNLTTPGNFSFKAMILYMPVLRMDYLQVGLMDQSQPH